MQAGNAQISRGQVKLGYRGYGGIAPAPRALEHSCVAAQGHWKFIHQSHYAAWFRFFVEGFTQGWLRDICVLIPSKVHRVLQCPPVTTPAPPG